jgi:hypothetical protein
MECTVTLDERLLDSARRALGTGEVHATVEASLREVIRVHGELAGRPQYVRTEAELRQYLREAQRPRTSAEQARWDAAVAAADRHRIDAGPNFDVVAEIREMRQPTSLRTSSSTIESSPFPTSAGWVTCSPVGVVR